MKRWATCFLSVIALVCLGACTGTNSGGGGKGVSPNITVQPTNQTVTAGQPASFTVAASGTAPLSYQWINAATSQNIAGATSATYTINQTTLAENGSTYRAIVTNSAGAANTQVVTLTVNAANAAPTITVQPANQTVTAGQTATFSVTATGTAPLSYQWQSAPAGSGTYTNVGSASASANLSVTNTTTAMSGTTYRVIVSNGVNPSATSNAATLTVNAVSASNVTVLTFHNDFSRTGQNLSETTLTTANVNSSQFGILGTIAVDGPVDGEPLYVGGLTVNGATHNVLFVATENDSVYAFDADTFTQLWQNKLLTGTGESPSDDHGCDQVEPTIGVTATPVIDLNAGPDGTIFVVAMSKSGGTYYQRLHALDLTTGTDRITAATIMATGFTPGQYEERTGLLLADGVIYLGWTSHCDAGAYNSWVMSYGESSLAQIASINLTPNGSEGGIWMAGDGLAADSSGNVYLLVGNGTFDTTLNGSGFPTNNDFGNGFIKLSTTNNALSVADYFEEFDTVSQSNADQDLGSGGLVLLPDMTDANNATRHLAVGAGKADLTRNGTPTMIFVVDRDNMGKFNPNSDSGIYQEIGGALEGGAGNGVWSAPAYFNSTLYYGAVDDNVKAFAITQAKVGTTASSESPETFSYPGTTPSISANGESNGIVWAIENGGGSNKLHAYDASNLANELLMMNSTPGLPFSGSSTTKFVTPMIANGKVYIGTGAANGNAGSVVVFGLTNQAARLRKRAKPPHDSRHWLQQPSPPHPGSSTPGF